MCVSLRNLSLQDIRVEVFYVDTSGTETSQDVRTLPPWRQFGDQILELKSRLDEGEERDCWRIKDPSGNIFLTVLLQRMV